MDRYGGGRSHDTSQFKMLSSMWLDSVCQILFLTAIVLVIFKLAEYVLWPVAALMFERIEQIVPILFAPLLRRVLISAFVHLLIAYWTALFAVWMAIRLIFDPQEEVAGEARETVIDDGKQDDASAKKKES